MIRSAWEDGMSGVRWAVLAVVGLLALNCCEAVAQTSPTPAESPACAGRTDVLGVSRIVEIDTAQGPRFGQRYKGSFLADGEVVLTFDDGPMRRYTMPILEALDEQCTKATFFAVGRMALADPETLKEVARRGHTIGSHTWSHKKLTTISATNANYELELGLSAVHAALGAPVAPFFRFPYLSDSRASLAYLAGRGIGTFGIDVDSRDFDTRNPGTVLRNVLSLLEKQRKGIILFHDIHPSTAGALASLLAELKARGFKVVHMVAKSPAATLPEFDATAARALALKLAAAAANPLAHRALTWPAAVTKEPASATPTGDNPNGLPWLDGAPTAAAASPPQPLAPRHSRANRQVPGNEPWQIRTFGN
jgi:peptidoglycan/xylan/chitin deacetylase (PgdA/CDA1 family)